ncbi:MAG: hypothetical protein U0457_05285 [Candidatus Sericytochromatia bacterium]
MVKGLATVFHVEQALDRNGNDIRVANFESKGSFELTLNSIDNLYVGQEIIINGQKLRITQVQPPDVVWNSRPNVITFSEPLSDDVNSSTLVVLSTSDATASSNISNPGGLITNERTYHLLLHMILHLY